MKNYIANFILLLALWALFFAGIGLLDLSQGYEIHLGENIFLSYILTILAFLAIKLLRK